MSRFDSIVNRQVETLTGVLRQYKEQRCREILRKARARGDEVVGHSRRTARARVHEAVTEERLRRENALLEARQRLDTQARRQVQKNYRDLLGAAWPELHRELAARWARPETRAEWCELLLEEACHMLGGDGWIVEHPDPETGAWSPDDRRRLEDALADRNMWAVEFKVGPGFEAGLRIRRDGACLDGTIAGLLARRTAVEGRLIAHWEAAAAEATQLPEAADG